MPVSHSVRSALEPRRDYAIRTANGLLRAAMAHASLALSISRLRRRLVTPKCNTAVMLRADGNGDAMIPSANFASSPLLDSPPGAALI
jgi:hypothetical protein